MGHEKTGRLTVKANSKCRGMKSCERAVFRRRYVNNTRQAKAQTCEEDDEDVEGQTNSIQLSVDRNMQVEAQSERRGRFKASVEDAHSPLH